ncbi:MAG: dihydrodipicolinate synthase family protein [Chloroflexi bacterium]|nr:dihydrodipicolinate synthase family protein [Chloroflexota bacterium]
MLRLSGVVGTPVTPFTGENRVDHDAVSRSIEFLLQNGVDALALPMHTGESLNLSLEERKELAETALATTAGRVPVIVHVSCPGTDHVIDLARHAERAGAAAVVVVTPYHWQPSEEELFEHFVRVGSSVGIGLLAYNFPKKLGVSVTHGLLARLIDRLDTFVGLKDASYDTQYFTEACRLTSTLRPGFAMFSGIEFMLPAMAMGAAGTFSPCGMIAPRLVGALYAACANGDYVAARALQYRFSRLWQALKVDYPASIKAGMEIMGRPVGIPRGPLQPLSAAAQLELRNQLEALGVLDAEPRGWIPAPARGATPTITPVPTEVNAYAPVA